MLRLFCFPFLVVLMAQSDVSANSNFAEAPYSLTIESEQLLPTSGDESVDVLGLRANLSVPLLEETNNLVGASFSLENLFYNWDEASAPLFDRLHDVRFNIFSYHKVDANWSLFTFSSLASRAEEGADLRDSLLLQGIYGAWFNGWENLLIGPGFGFSTKFDSVTSIYPILVLDWEFCPDWHFSSRPTPGTRIGAGLSLSYEPESVWAWYLGAKYLTNQYSLQEGDVYEYSTYHLYSTCSYQVGEHLFLSLTGGVNVGGKVQLPEIERSLGVSHFAGLDIAWRY